MLKSACLLGAALLAAGAQGDVVVLSTLLGAPPGSATSTPNPPFTTFVSTVAYSLGVDCPGPWTSILVRFSDAGPFERAIGQHPPEFGESRVDFSLDALRTLTGREVVAFEAVVGIETQTSIENNGAAFIVRLDGQEAQRLGVAGRLAPSRPLSVPLAGQSTLSLVTQRTGSFNSNHACWADARVTLGAPLCPADFNRDGFLDFFDYDDYVRCFESGDCPAGRDADFNGDGFADFFDYDDFVAAFQAGC